MRTLRPIPRLLAALLLAPNPGLAQAGSTSADELASTLRERALDDRRAYQLVRSLTAEVGPRLAGSAGDRRAVAWAEVALRELGLAAVRSEPVTVPHWERGEAVARIVAPHPQPLVLTALGGSIGTPEEGITAEVVRVGSLEELEGLADDAVRGRIVFIDRQMERHRDGSGYGEVVPIRTRGASQAAAKGAVASLIRSVGTGTHRFPHTGTTRYEEGVAPIPALALAIPDAELLATQLAGGEPVVVHLRSTSRMLPEALSANVLAEVPGGERAEEIVLLACHLDSWDLGTGAIDDA
ncbi:MAG TPA: M28 family peptidase, partial [Thermoanaerobaculia bacterium]|nr:M28 family peptidase [Thermoanaerobaculia bacterium]